MKLALMTDNYNDSPSDSGNTILERVYVPLHNILLMNYGNN